MSDLIDSSKKVSNGDMAEIICVICPNSCRLHVFKDEKGEIQVEGNQCNRGAEYGKQEFIEPKRMLITTMRIKNGVLPVIPVRSNTELPKKKIFDAVKEVNQAFANAPIEMGDIIIENIFGLGINVIASRSMETKKETQ